MKIKLATITPQGGSLELEGLNARNAILLAVDEFNAGNPNIEVSLAEGIETPGPDQAAASAAESGSDPMVMGMIGPMTSLAAQAVLRELEPKNLPMISPSATRDDLNRQGFTMFHRVVPYTKMECACAAGIIADDLQAKKVFIVSNPETAEFAEETPQFLVNNHGLASGMIEKAQVPREETEFSGLISAIKAFGTDVCFAPLASPAQCAALAAQMQRLGYKVQLVGVDLGGDKNEFVSGAEGATEGMYVASLGPLLGSSDKPKTVEFVEKFRSKFGEPSAFTGHAYEAAGIMLEAFARAFETGGGQVTRQGVAQALADTRYDGVLNFTVQFDPNGDLTKSGVFVCRVQDGRLVQLKLAAY